MIVEIRGLLWLGWRSQSSCWLSSWRSAKGHGLIGQGCISCGTCSYLELTEDHVLTSAYVKIFRIVTRNAVNKSFWRKKDCSWPPLNKYAMNIWLSSLKIRAHLSWRTGKHLHVLHVLRTYSTCSCPGQQDTTTYAALLHTYFSTNILEHNFLHTYSCKYVFEHKFF